LDAFLDVLNHDQLHSKTLFFGKSPVVVCCEITHLIDKALRQSLSKYYKNGIIIQVEGKEFKVD
jgi:hypothetical protein